jgi:anti-sigma factor (TIGR02949 family)
MSALKVPSDCEWVSRSLDPYVDGELDPSHAIDIEGHLSACRACAEQAAFARAMRRSLRRMTAPAAPAALRARVCASIIEQRLGAPPQGEPSRDDDAAQHDDESRPKLIRRRYAVALAAAAGLVFAAGVSQRQRDAGEASFASAGQATRASVVDHVTPDSLLDDLVALHAEPLPPETTNPKELEPFIGVPVRPIHFAPLGASFRGARVNAMNQRRTAVLQYTVDGQHRLTMYVFDSHAIPVNLSTKLSPRYVEASPVYVGKLRGYSVAAIEQSGVGYAIASDLDDVESAELVARAVQP